MQLRSHNYSEDLVFPSSERGAVYADDLCESFVTRYETARRHDVDDHNFRY